MLVTVTDFFTYISSWPKSCIQRAYNAHCAVVGLYSTLNRMSHVVVIVKSKLLKLPLKSKRRAQAYSRAPLVRVARPLTRNDLSSLRHYCSIGSADSSSTAYRSLEPGRTVTKHRPNGFEYGSWQFLMSSCHITTVSCKGLINWSDISSTLGS